MKQFGLVFSLLLVQQGFTQLQYPVTRKVDTVDNYFGTQVADPYRWLEDDNSDETKAWVKAQNAATQNYLAQIPYRDKVRKRLEDLWNYTRYSAPYRRGSWWYFTKNDGLQNQSVWYRQKEVNGKAEVFLDPNKLSEDGTVSLGSSAFSKDGKFFVYAIQKAGSDWQEGAVMNASTKEKLTDNLQWLKFTGFAWKGDDGFYYSRYPEPKAEDKLKGKNLYHALYYHKLGTPQSADVLVYEDKDHPQRLINAGLTEDERFLCLYIREGSSSGVEIKVKDLQSGQNDFTTLISGGNTQAGIVDNVDGKLLVQTNDGASNYKVVLVDPKNPSKEAWKE
ncbi:MAG TPA: S9 family peptidase, partial [Flavisolibacter sp.]|nr:S9 family peptidase [Flavisolibacter sp.]